MVVRTVSHMPRFFGRRVSFRPKLFVFSYTRWVPMGLLSGEDVLPSYSHGQPRMDGDDGGTKEGPSRVRCLDADKGVQRPPSSLLLAARSGKSTRAWARRISMLISRGLSSGLHTGGLYGRVLSFDGIELGVPASHHMTGRRLCLRWRGGKSISRSIYWIRCPS